MSDIENEVEVVLSSSNSHNSSNPGSVNMVVPMPIVHRSAPYFDGNCIEDFLDLLEQNTDRVRVTHSELLKMLLTPETCIYDDQACNGGLPEHVSGKIKESPDDGIRSDVDDELTWKTMRFTLDEEFLEEAQDKGEEIKLEKEDGYWDDQELTKRLVELVHAQGDDFSDEEWLPYELRKKKRQRTGVHDDSVLGCLDAY
ncbi:hypothetical protein C0995_001718 [Termitomyces sp. Mi166|nr:hypothetical protein C0995_001718 [Termitomyces sp. Mi166\